LLRLCLGNVFMMLMRHRFLRVFRWWTSST